MEVPAPDDIEVVVAADNIPFSLTDAADGTTIDDF